MAVTAVALVHAAARHDPDGLALRYLCTDRSVGALTYGQVWDLSARVAARLSGAVLGVAIDDGPYLALAELAGWRRGMVLVPMDPHDPVARLRAVASEAGATCIVTKDWGDAKRMAELEGCTVLDLSTEVPLDSAAGGSPEATLEPLDPDSVAYMWFTSGSTGLPKGCLVSHRAFHNWCLVKNPPHGISDSSVVLIASASTFDPSIGDIFATWAAGATVAVAPRMLFFANLGWVINQLEVTHITCTPSLWQYLEADIQLPTLQALCLGGERCPQPLLNEWAGRLKLLNTYGTTECTVWQTLRLMLPEDRVTLVGKAYPGNEIRVVQRDGFATVADGDKGEIVQGGVQVGLGYHNRPELTKERFVPMPGLEGRWYRTGDGGRIAEDGHLEVLGRFDSQVKIRGMRVELGDIEAGVVKAGSGLLSNCAVVLRGDFLQAYCQVSKEASIMMHEPFSIFPVVSDYLLQRSSLELPRHMLPSRFILMQRLPQTPNGKVDRQKLPEVVETCASSSSSLTAMEQIVADVWGEVLGRTGIGANDHFLSLGGHSLSVLQVSRKLLALATAAGQDTSVTSPTAMLLAPEKLIHSPRLRLYCQMLARGGVCLSRDVEVEVQPVDKEDAADLRINYVKHKVKRPRYEEDALELDHDAWEQVPSATDGELVCRASEAGLVPMVRLLLEQNAPVEGHLTGQYERHGLTPLHLAVLGNHVCCAEILLERKADAMRRDSHGALPLHKAAERAGPRMIDLLVSSGADAEAIDTASRSTALHLASRSGNITAVAELAKRVCLDWLDRWDRTALHWAAFHGHLEVCRALVMGRANLEGTVGERGGRFLFAKSSCGNLPQRVAKKLKSFVTPAKLARDRFGEGPIVELLTTGGALQDTGE